MVCNSHDKIHCQNDIWVFAVYGRDACHLASYVHEIIGRKHSSIWKFVTPCTSISTHVCNMFPDHVYEKMYWLIATSIEKWPSKTSAPAERSLLSLLVPELPKGEWPVIVQWISLSVPCVQTLTSTNSNILCLTLQPIAKSYFEVPSPNGCWLRFGV